MTGRADPRAVSRIAGLDVARAWLMLGGILVHGSAWLPATPLFTIVDLFSSSFRMGAFFAIAGYLSAVGLRKRPARQWLAQRTARLGVPTMFGIAVLSPVTWMLIVSRDGHVRGNEPGLFHWHHIWFLVGLLGYSAVASAIPRLSGRWPIVRSIDTQAPRVVLLAVATAVAALSGVTGVMLRSLLSSEALRAFALVQLIIGYLPMFLFGMALVECPRLRERILADWRYPAIIVGVIIAANIAYMSGAPIRPEYLRFTSGVLGPPAASVLIFRWALSVRAAGPFVSRLSDASFTIYLLHYPIAVAVNTHAGMAFEHPIVRYAFAITIAASSSFAVHELVVRRSPLLSWLLNGTPMPTTGPAKPAPNYRPPTCLSPRASASRVWRWRSAYPASAAASRLPWHAGQATPST